MPRSAPFSHSFPRLALVAGSVLVAGWLLVAGPALAVEPAPVRQLDQQNSLEGATAVNLKVPVGDLTITGSSRDNVAVHVDIHCKKSDRSNCLDAAGRISLAVRRDGNWLVVDVDGFPKLGGGGLSADVRLEMPAGLRFQADTGVGDIEVSNLENDIEIDTGVGDITVRAATAKVKSISADSGVGDVTLTLDGNRVSGSGFVGKGLDWSGGKGSAHLELDSGVGDIAIELK